VEHVPGAWEAIILSLAAFRIWRLLGADTILNRPREWLTRLNQYERKPLRYRQGLDIWLHCPWCLGFWVAIAVWGAWLAWPTGTLIFCTPWMIGAAVGLIQRNLDP
jgi:hypothetical protein